MSDPTTRPPSGRTPGSDDTPIPVDNLESTPAEHAIFGTLIVCIGVMAINLTILVCAVLIRALRK